MIIIRRANTNTNKKLYKPRFLYYCGQDRMC